MQEIDSALYVWQDTPQGIFADTDESESLREKPGTIVPLPILSLSVKTMSPDQVKRTVTEFFGASYNTLVGYAYRSTRCHSLAEDVVQEVLLELFRELTKGTEIHSLLGWSLKVTRHRISCRLLQEKRFLGGLELLERLDPVRREDVEYRAGLDERVWLREVQDLFSLLSRREEEVVLLWMEGLKYREIADLLQISPKSVETFFTRGFRKLRKALRAKDPQTAECDTRPIATALTTS